MGTAGRIGVEDGEGFFPPPEIDPSSPEFNRLHHEWATNQAVIDFAGHAAIVALLGIGDMSHKSAIANGAGPDFEKAYERLGNEAEPIQDAKDRALQIVISRRTDIEIISDKLLELKQLDPQQVDLLISGGWSTFLNDDGSPRS